MPAATHFSLTRAALLMSAVFVAQPASADAIDEMRQFLTPPIETAAAETPKEAEAPKAEEKIEKPEPATSQLPPATLLDEKKLDAFFNKQEQEKTAPKAEEKPAAPVELKAEEKKPEEPKPAEELLASKSVNDALTEEPRLPPMPVADPKAFNAMLAHVYANHLQLKAQRESLKATDETVSQALSGFLPNVGAGYSKGRERNNNLADKWNYDNTTGKSLVVTQQLFNGGETIASYAAAKDRVKAARAELSAVEQQVLYNAVAAYTDVVEKQAVLELNQKNGDVLKQQLEATQARFDVGELTITDIAQSKARLAGAEASERQALGDLEAAKATFKRIIGYDVPGKIDMPGVPSGLPTTLSESNSWAQAANPILEAAKHNENAAADNIYVQSSALLPDVNLQGIINRVDGGSTGGFSNRDNDALTLNVSIPIYQSGAEWSRIRQARKQAQQAKFNALDTNGSVVESVTRAWEDYNTATALITSNEAAVKAAETALDGVKKENEFGVRTILDVLDAEQEAFSARVNLVKAVRAEKVQAYRLLAAVGRLTARDLKLETDVANPKEHYDSIKYQLLGL